MDLVNFPMSCRRTYVYIYAVCTHRMAYMFIRLYDRIYVYIKSAV
jgi:hypothetical protein